MRKLTERVKKDVVNERAFNSEKKIKIVQMSDDYHQKNKKKENDTADERSEDSSIVKENWIPILSQDTQRD